MQESNLGHANTFAFCFPLRVTLMPGNISMAYLDGIGSILSLNFAVLARAQNFARKMYRVFCSNQNLSKVNRMNRCTLDRMLKPKCV